MLEAVSATEGDGRAAGRRRAAQRGRNVLDVGRTESVLLLSVRGVRTGGSTGGVHMAHRAIHRTGSTRSVVAELCPGRVATENLVALRVVARRLRLRRHIDEAEAAVRKNGVGGAPTGRRGRVCCRRRRCAVLLALRNIVATRHTFAASVVVTTARWAVYGGMVAYEVHNAVTTGVSAACRRSTSSGRHIDKAVIAQTDGGDAGVAASRCCCVLGAPTILLVWRDV